MPTRTPDRLMLGYVALVSILGAVARLRHLGASGLTHFDEGIYALAGHWSTAPDQMETLFVATTPYAPPAFPILVGLLNAVVGTSDISTILVAQFAGSLVTPLVTWVAWGTWGRTAAGVSATLAAGSAIHQSFSGVALTDSLFLSLWLLAFGMARRFLDRPGAVSGIGLGLSVGLLQHAKYHGWLIGGFVAIAAMWETVRPNPTRPRSHRTQLWAWGLLAALVAATVVAPWVVFVERHGGYRDLLRHQRSYLGGWWSWPAHWLAQMRQVNAFRHPWPLPALTWVVLAVASTLVIGEPEQSVRCRRLRAAMVAFIAGAVILVPAALWLCGVAWLVGRDARGSAGDRLWTIAWVVLGILTPFYHPYVRLWLPIEALGWLAAGAIVAAIPRRFIAGSVEGPDTTDHPGWRLAVGPTVALGVGVGVAVAATFSSKTLGSGSRPFEDRPTAAIREGLKRVGGLVPDPRRRIRLYARPSVRFYLLGQVTWLIEDDRAGFERAGRGVEWGLYDGGMADATDEPALLPESVLKTWEVVERLDTELSLPAILDIDPGAAANPVALDRRRVAPIWLLKPRGAMIPR